MEKKKQNISPYMVIYIYIKPFPIGWLISRGGWRFTPLTTGFYDDRWYTSSRPLYFYQKDIIGSSHY